MQNESLIRRINNANSDLARLTRSSADRLEQLKSDSTISQERIQEQARLDTLRDSRLVSPDATLDVLSRQAERGSIAAGFGAGFAATQVDFANSINQRVSDAEQRLAELRQRDRDRVDGERLEFQQTQQVDQVSIAGAREARDNLRAELEFSVSEEQRAIENDDRQEGRDIQRENAATSRANAETSRLNANTQAANQRETAANNAFNRSITASRENREIATQLATANTQLSGLEDRVASALEVTETQQLIDKKSAEKLIEDSVKLVGLEGFELLFESSRPSEAARKGEFLADNGASLVSRLGDIQDPESRSVAFEAISQEFSKAADLLERELSDSETNIFFSPNERKQINDRIEKIGTLSAIMNDAQKRFGNQDPDVRSARDQIEVLKAQVQALTLAQSTAIKAQ